MSFDYYPINTYSTALAVIAAVLLDALLGEPKRWHPLVGFGWIANHIERIFNQQMLPHYARIVGLVTWLLLLLPFAAISYLVTNDALMGATFTWIANVTLLYFAIGAQSLTQHAKAVFKPLSEQNLPQARHAISMIVSRDTSQLNETEIATATVESVLENGNDAIFGAIFWFVLFGGTGTVIFRLANTLDAMWGYKTPRFLYFGWAAARLDDLLNLVPARLTALSYALCGHTKSAFKCWVSQSRTWYSPNAGPVMSAGAGALQVKLGGNAVYHGTAKQRPTLGMGALANAGHILRAVNLIWRTIVLWCVAIMLGAVFINIIESYYLA